MSTSHLVLQLITAALVLLSNYFSWRTSRHVADIKDAQKVIFNKLTGGRS